MNCFVCLQMIIAIVLIALVQTANSFKLAFPAKFYGEWLLRHTTLSVLPVNRVVINIYPDNHLTLEYRFLRGPFVFHKSCIGSYCVSCIDDDNCDIENTQVNVKVSFHHTEEKFLSAYGIGLQNLNILTAKRASNHLYDLSTTVVGMDDIYLYSKTSIDMFHLVRSVRLTEPSIDIPITSFVISQVIATILGHLIHLFIFHSSD